MRFGPVFHVVGYILQLIGVAMLLPIPWGLYYHEEETYLFVICAIITFATGLALNKLLKEENDKLRVVEGIGIVSFGWIITSVFGALPFYLSGNFSFVDSFFEIISGFTTTGASIINDVEALPHCILFWRSLSHWIGGMGIIFLAFILLPALSVGGRELISPESSVTQLEKIKPRLRDVAKSLYGIYLLFTGAQIILLLFGGMNIFDSMCHTFGTIATGGFSTKNTSIAYYNSPYIEGVIVLFMFLGATSFTLHYNAFRRKFDYFKDEEFIFYVGILAFSILFMTLDIRTHIYDSLSQSFRYATFQVMSISTTTGFATADFNLYPDFSRLILVLLMIMGGCAGSTAGAIKIMRITILTKAGVRELKKIIHPHAVMPINFRGKVIPQETLVNIGTFFASYLAVYVVSCLIMTGLGVDMITSLSAVAATMGGVGPGLGLVGPATTYYVLGPGAKILLSFCMLVGRLEIFTLLVLLSPAYWKE
ncbi:MAG: TrkH family potassium uptake protein [Candidatus Methanofastidiosum sp.]|nr:TrkH family potassium uptake protein [Methanofastidiosum sp.]